MLHTLQLLLLSVFPAMVIVGGLKDITSYTIPNWISGVLIAGFFLAAVGVGLPWQSALMALGVGVAALFLAMGMFALGWIGGGDAKLFAAAALWLGWPASLTFVLVTGLAGGALALSLLGLRSVWLRPLAVRGPDWVGRLAEPGGDAPYGVAIAIGALAAFPESPLVEAFARLA
ncbi:pilus assembly protein CpaA [Caulobacter sp. SLTY]|uniref:A24 family peptidase n=1 Tax=Caulobacter sp. SLTY TaxID=2683262 RepID=UPI001412E499|nr:prepilin peptidase [Caulobacter sp. SLTY]NBB16561.1 pilus assembly protein CpaA [Caulobacter sp. SLTY]